MKLKVQALPVTAYTLAAHTLAFWPVWLWYASRLTDGSDEPWGLVALMTAIIFLVVSSFSSTTAARTESYPLLLSSVLLLFYMLSFFFFPPILRACIALLSLGAVLSRLYLRTGFHFAFFALLILSLPVIASLQFYAGYPLRLFVAQVVAALLSLANIFATPSGTSLYWMGEIISVDAPCSGIKMLWSGLYLCFALSAFARLSNFETWLCYIFSLSAVFSANILRALILFLAETRIIELPTWGHSATGVVCFALAASLICKFINSKKGRTQCSPKHQALFYYA